MKCEFEMSNLGPITSYLRMTVEDNDRYIKLHQASFIRSCLAKFKPIMKKFSIPYTAG